ncbi:MAG: DUF2066 domain-containing protein [Methylococcales bacterium]|nr:DUF2066 domain-containing protein [Methylococcales bacterium]
MKVHKRVLIVFFILISQISYAEEVKRLYETEVIVNSERKQDRAIATKNGLSILLTRILVGKDILQNKIVKNVLANTQYYVSEYQYSLGGTGFSNSRIMRVLFDEKLLVDTFRTAKIGLWNEIRPRTLLWLVVESDNKQQFFDSTLMPELDLALTKASNKKKLPILFPIQDLNENRKLSISDVLSAYSDHLLERSARYDVVSTLAGKMVNKGECWEAEWTLYFNSKIKQWSSQCGLINEIALDGFQGVYNRLSKYYAVTPDAIEINSIVLKIGDNNSINKEKITNYLESLPMVKTVTWLNKELGYEKYRIFFQGSRMSFNNYLKKDYFLRAEEHSKQLENEMRYKLLIN